MSFPAVAPMQAPLAVSLRQRVLHAGSWSLAGYALSQLIRFGSNLLMTRLLVPEMFGVMAIATMVMYGLALFSDVGLRQSVVQSRHGDVAKFLNTAWSLQIVRGALMALLAICTGLGVLVLNRWGLVPPNSAYAEPVLPVVIGALALNAIIAGFESTKIFEASRKLALRRVTQIEVITQIGGLLAMLAWVTFDRSIWALVAGGTCSALLRTVLSHAWLPGIANRWQWDSSAVHEILHFGKWIMASSILGFLVNSGDRLMLGGMLSAASLGVYVIAFLTFNAVEQALSKIISEVSFPALSEIVRERPDGLKTGYYRFHSIIASCTYACAGMLVISGQTLIELLYDRRYAGAGEMLEILAVALFAVPFRLAPQCLIALGMPRLLTNIIAIRLVALFVMTPVGFKLFGVPGALWGIALSNFSCLPLTLVYKIKYGLFDFKKELLLLPAVLAGMLAGKVFNFMFGH